MLDTPIARPSAGVVREARALIGCGRHTPSTRFCHGPDVPGYPGTDRDMMGTKGRLQTPLRASTGAGGATNASAACDSNREVVMPRKKPNSLLLQKHLPGFEPPPNYVGTAMTVTSHSIKADRGVQKYLPGFGPPPSYVGTQ